MNKLKPRTTLTIEAMVNGQLTRRSLTMDVTETLGPTSVKAMWHVLKDEIKKEIEDSIKHADQ
jgi:hypothetical protein